MTSLQHNVITPSLFLQYLFILRIKLEFLKGAAEREKGTRRWRILVDLGLWLFRSNYVGLNSRINLQCENLGIIGIIYLFFGIGYST